jgi:hypothetical protein
MREAALALIEAAGPAESDRLRSELDDPAFRTWTYLPGGRPGQLLADQTAGQRACVWRLVEAGHGAVGNALVMGAMAVERIRRELVGGKPVEDDRYWIRVHGDPGGDDVWGWRLNGHHIGVHVLARDSRMTITPHFIGAEPAEVRSGPGSGRRVLASEEDLARALLVSMDRDQRRAAVFAEQPPDDILTRADPVADPDALPRGLPYSRMTDEQRHLCMLLIQRYVERAPEAYAARCLEEIAQSPGETTFSWAGSAARGEPHYYCVRTAGSLIEYDNTQDGGNHAHSVWRHLRDDFGGDLLREHYRTQHGG